MSSDRSNRWTVQTGGPVARVDRPFKQVDRSNRWPGDTYWNDLSVRPTRLCPCHPHSIPLVASTTPLHPARNSNPSRSSGAAPGFVSLDRKVIIAALIRSPRNTQQSVVPNALRSRWEVVVSGGDSDDHCGGIFYLPFCDRCPLWVYSLSAPSVMCCFASRGLTCRLAGKVQHSSGLGEGSASSGGVAVVGSAAATLEHTWATCERKSTRYWQVCERDISQARA